MLFKKSKRNKANVQVDDSTRSSSKDVKQYVVDQCEHMIEIAKDIIDTRDELKVVSSYLKDVEEFEKLPKEKKEPIEEAAKSIVKLYNTKDEILKKKHDLPEERFQEFKSNEEEIPKAIKRLQNNEAFQDSAKKDMNYLEGEKIRWRDIEECSIKEQRTLRYLSVFLTVIFGVILIVLAVSYFSLYMDVQKYMILSGFIAVLSVGYIIIRFQDTTTNIRKSKVNTKQAIILENRAKLKYVNATNAVRFSREKYKVKNSYEFLYLWEQYNAICKERKQIKEIKDDLIYYTEKLHDLIEDLDLTDPEFWNKYFESFAEKKEMIEIKHSLVNRRSKLKQSIEYNKNAVDIIKKDVDSKVAQMGQNSIFIGDIIDQINNMLNEDNTDGAIKVSKLKQEKSKLISKTSTKEQENAPEKTAEKGAPKEEFKDLIGVDSEEFIDNFKNTREQAKEKTAESIKMAKNSAYSRYENSDFMELADEIDRINEFDKDQFVSKTASEGIYDAVNRTTSELREIKEIKQKEKDKIKEEKRQKELQRIEKERKEREARIAEEKRREKEEKQREIEKRLREQEEARKIEELQKDAKELRDHAVEKFSNDKNNKTVKSETNIIETFKNEKNKMTKNKDEQQENNNDNAKKEQPKVMTQADILAARVRANKEIDMRKKLKAQEQAKKHLQEEQERQREQEEQEKIEEAKNPRRRAAIEELVVDVPWNPNISGLEQARRRDKPKTVV
ncbi:hypothetical protein [Lachnobacterium bovis]|uniref:hypothetical protein n=1 Tax=Lachnobacterium bovis TaxID=140626 RepID=UPI000484F502|nr:hypothetical protein [Lachnobacterium bovis]